MSQVWNICDYLNPNYKANYCVIIHKQLLFAISDICNVRYLLSLGKQSISTGDSYSLYQNDNYQTDSASDD